MPTLERMYEIHDDLGHYKLQIGPDRDGLEMIEIRYYNAGEPKPATSVCFTVEEARLVSQVLAELSIPSQPETKGETK